VSASLILFSEFNDVTKMREEVLKGLGFEVFALEDGKGLGVFFEFELHVNSFDINFDFSII
jgi:hypothetical protein